MAQYNGYRSVPHSSYNEWRASTNGNGYNVDNYYGNQCWDFVALLYWQYGLTLVTRPGGGIAADCWVRSRQANSRTPFISLTGVENIKRGDILVWNSSPYNGDGHIAFADEDYSPGMTRIYSFGQSPLNHGLNGVAQVDRLSLNYFLGIFRNTEWQSTPPTPTPSGEKKKHEFPWPVAWANWPGFKH